MLQGTSSALIIVINHVTMFSPSTQYTELKIYSEFLQDYFENSNNQRSVLVNSRCQQLKLTSIWNYNDFYLPQALNHTGIKGQVRDMLCLIAKRGDA